MDLLLLIELLLAHAIEASIIIAVTGIAVSSVIKALFGVFSARYRRRLVHRERMAEIEARIATAKALAAAPEEAQRAELAQQLLEAYGEAGEGLKNDEKGSLVRWSISS